MSKVPKQHLVEEYFTVKELSEKIKFSKQSLYNLIYRGTFVLGKHYLKPTPKKVLFKWAEVREWMGESLPSGQNIVNDSDPIEKASSRSGYLAVKKPPSLINI